MMNYKTMKTINKLLIICCIMMSCDNNSTQEISGSNTIKVYLLGTFHFNQTEPEYNVLDKEKQESIEELCSLVAIQKPNKVFVERQPEFEFQNKIDSLYSNYVIDGKLNRKNEIFQIGFRLAKRLGHKKIYQCDNPGRYNYLMKTAMEYAKKNNQLPILVGEAVGTIERYDEIVNEDSIMQNNSLLHYMRWINSTQVMKTSHAFYITNLTQLGSHDFYNYDDDDTLLGAQVVADWYRRNIMIYTKMINQVDYSSDKAIFLVMGSDHIPILEKLFNDNPNFEVIKNEVWLQ